MTTEEQATPVEISSSLRSPTPLDDILEELVEDLQEPPKKKAKSRVPTDAVTCLPSNVMQSWIRHPEHTIQTDWVRTRFYSIHYSIRSRDIQFCLQQGSMATVHPICI
jgi:hypothetical protein